MITGTYPFPGKDQNEVFEKIKKGVYDVNLLEKQRASEEVKDLIKKLLVHDKNKRLPITEALNHTWFTKNKNVDDLHQLIDDNIIDSISNFAHRNLIQKEILFYLAKISTENEITKLKQAFSEIDKDKSGTIESDEIVTIFQKLGKRIDTVEYINLE
jgi:calcium-dependent protein kinase